MDPEKDNELKRKLILSDRTVAQIAAFEEFANGGTVVSVRVKSGAIYRPVVICNYRLICAVLGYEHPPFFADEVETIWQSDEDKSVRRGEHQWKFFVSP